MPEMDGYETTAAIRRDGRLFEQAGPALRAAGRAGALETGVTLKEEIYYELE
jgi:hypothetical protein